MTDKDNSELLKSMVGIHERVSVRLYCLKCAYLLILQSEQTALEGHEKLHESFKNLDARLKSTNMDTNKFFVSLLFLDAISEIEVYFSDLIQVVITRHPKKLSSTTFKLNEIIDASSIDELISRASDEYVNKLMYKKPMEYLDAICDVLSVEKIGLLELWPLFVEAKARRDLGVHNSWICNATYLRKLKEADINTKANMGDNLVPDYDNYLKDVLDGLMQLTMKIANSLDKKYP